MKTLGCFIGFLFLLPSLIYCDRDKDPKNVIIDESDQTESVISFIKIDSVWAGHPVGFSLLTNRDRQYIAYYNAERHMVVGQRNLSDESYTLHEMTPTFRETSKGTSTVLGWDSHNSVTIAIDKDGFIHLSGNMHVHPLTYFKSGVPEDIFTLEQVWSMTGANEDRCTYPRFTKTREGELLFHYRDGASGSGNEIYNIYSCETKQWSRLLDTPLTDGKGLMNAYQSEPVLMADGWYHVYWVWRDTPDCATNHDLSYMKSPDLKNWYNADGKPVTLPATIDDKSIIVDPIPVKGGIINLAAKLCFDEKNNPYFAYHKYDLNGNLQFYVARIVDEMWVSIKVTDWDYRWEFSGGGSINVEVRLNDFKKRNDGYFELSYWHIKYGSGTLLLNDKFEICGTVRKPNSFTSVIEKEGTFPGLEIRTAGDIGKPAEDGVRYVLKWETLSANRDRARPEPWPEPSQLYLYKLKTVK